MRQDRLAGRVVGNREPNHPRRCDARVDDRRDAVGGDCHRVRRHRRARFVDEPSMAVTDPDVVLLSR